MFYLMISIMLICVSLVAIAYRYFEYKENTEKDKEDG